MGFWDSITDAVEDVGGAISDVAEDAYDSVTHGAVGDVIAGAAEVVDTASFGLAGRALNATDDYVFDTVDYVTGGTLDVDFDDGNFTVGAGFDGLARVGASVGEDGITANSEALIGGGFDVGMTHDGFTASGSAGIDWGPLPYAEGHVELAANGDVLVNGRAQGTLPTPYGIFSGKGDVGFASTDAGWGGYINSQGSWVTPTGVTLGAGEHLAYQETDAGSQLSVGVNGSVGYAGLTVGGGVDYARAETADGDVVQSVGADGSVSYMGMTAKGGVEYARAENADGDVVDGVHLEGEVDAVGMSVSGQADYHHTQIDGVETSDWSGDYDVDGPSLDSALQTAGTLASSELGGDEAVGADGVVGADDVLGTVPDVGPADVVTDLAPADVVTDLAPADVAPMDDFSTAIDAADSVEQSMDGLTQDLTTDL